jgi:hypothetical protein
MKRGGLRPAQSAAMGSQPGFLTGRRRVCQAIEEEEGV